LGPQPKSVIDVFIVELKLGFYYKNLNLSFASSPQSLYSESNHTSTADLPSGAIDLSKQCTFIVGAGNRF
jgi:hypothetical protein